MPYTDDMTPTSEFSFVNFTQTTFDPATTEGYVSGVVGDVLVGLSAPLVTLTDGTQYTVRYANKLIQLGLVENSGVTWTDIGVTEYDSLQGVPDILANGNTVVVTWSNSDLVYVYQNAVSWPLPTVYAFDGISSALASTVQFGLCAVYIGLDGCIHIMELGEGTWIEDHTMSADLADDTVRVARAFVSPSTEFVTERLALLMFREVATVPAYFYMVSNTEPWVDPEGGGGDPTVANVVYETATVSSLSPRIDGINHVA